MVHSYNLETPWTDHAGTLRTQNSIHCFVQIPTQMPPPCRDLSWPPCPKSTPQFSFPRPALVLFIILISFSIVLYCITCSSTISSLWWETLRKQGLLCYLPLYSQCPPQWETHIQISVNDRWRTKSSGWDRRKTEECAIIEAKRRECFRKADVCLHPMLMRVKAVRMESGSWCPSISLYQYWCDKDSFTMTFSAAL